MTPLQKIKEGILTNDKYLIVEGYNALTSDRIELEEEHEHRVRQTPPPSRRRQYRPDEEFILDGDVGDRNNDVKVEARVEQFQPRRRINLFADDGNTRLPEYSRKDREIDQANRNAPRSAPAPKPYVPVKAVCNACGRTFSVNPIHVMSGGYRCDGCNRR